jgi:hypothetical protein
MAFALIDQKVQGHTRVQYIVCVNFLALTFAVGLEIKGQTLTMQERLKALQDRYRRNAFAALHNISVLNPPSLPLLQALLAGVSPIPNSSFCYKKATNSTNAIRIFPVDALPDGR